MGSFRLIPDLRILYMRADILPGATLPDYELSDHTAKRRNLLELQGPDPMSAHEAFEGGAVNYWTPDAPIDQELW